MSDSYRLTPSQNPHAS